MPRPLTEAEEETFERNFWEIRRLLGATDDSWDHLILEDLRERDKLGNPTFEDNSVRALRIKARR